MANNLRGFTSSVRYLVESDHGSLPSFKGTRAEQYFSFHSQSEAIMKTEGQKISELILVITIVALPMLAFGQKGHFQMPALGRTAQLGEFYDARSEEFLGQSVFRQRLPPDLVKTTEVPWMNSRFDTTDKQSGKRKLLKMEIGLYISIMLGIIKISGKCSYLKEDQDSFGSISSYLSYETRTVKDSVDLFLNDIRNIISDDRLSTVEATHIVTSIEYGADAVIEFLHMNATFQDTETITAGFFAQAKALLGLVGASAEVDITVENHYLSSNNDVTINIFGDIPAGSTTPQSYQEVMDYIRDIPVLTKNYNKGKGKPVVYTLFPIDAIRQKYSVRARSILTLEDVEPMLLQHLVRMTDQMQETKLILKDLATDVNTFSECITTPDLKRVNQLYEDYLAFSEKFKGIFKNALIAVRSGEQSNAYLNDTISNYTSNPLSATKVKIQVQEDFQNISEKLRIYKTFILSEKTEYWSTLSSLVLVNPGKNVYVLFYSPRLVQKNITSWLACSSLFHRLTKIPSNHMVVLDCEFPSANCEDLENVELRQYRNGKLITNDTTRDFKFFKKLDPIQVPAFGRKESIGALYNSQTGKFVGSSILQQNVFDVDEVMEYVRESKIVFPKTFREKMEILRIPPDVAVQAFTHNVECRTSCEFIRRPLTQQNVTGIYVHTVKSNVDTALDLILAEGVDLTATLESGATHFVHQVIYGTTTIVEVEIPDNSIECDENLLKFDLEDLREFTAAGFDNSTTDNTDPVDFQMRSKGSIRVYSDVLDLSINFKEDKNGLKHFMKNLQQAITSIDQGKGVPITYVLEPFQNFELYFGTLKPRIFQPPNLKTSDFQQIVRSYEEIMEARAEIASWSLNFQEKKPCVMVGDEMTLEGLRLQFEHQCSLWLADLKTAIDEGKPKEYFEIFKNLTHHYKISKAAILEKLETELGWTTDKINLIKTGKQNGIGYLGRTTNDMTRNNNSSLKTYIFHLKREFQQQKELWSKNLFLFYSLNLPKHRLFFLDCDFEQSNCNGITGPAIHEYIKGVRIPGDFSRQIQAQPGLMSNQDDIQKLQEFTAALIKDFQKLNKDSAGQFRSSLNRTFTSAVNNCGASLGKLFESYDRLMCPAVQASCPR
ncbi:unnamed protein product [Allacma fusca]|uniref:Uncharacterized protein n=1 Tax=Allacma fusca TaxID=39272 RepID=A0A8J2JR73_9HEXA|nr:unnamed protein product [Allacma fusca]